MYNQHSKIVSFLSHKKNKSIESCEYCEAGTWKDPAFFLQKRKKKFNYQYCCQLSACQLTNSFSTTLWRYCASALC